LGWGFFLFLGSLMSTITDELSAVNIMLGVIGESPINSLASISGVSDAVTARQVLNEISTTVQSEGWAFNTEKNWAFLPDSTGTLVLPSNILQVDPVDSSLKVQLRGTRLYDLKNHTFTFTDSIKLDCVLLFDFNDLPQAARYYIAVRAARVFQARTVGSDALNGFTKQDEALARVAVKNFDTSTGGYNMLTGSYSVAKTLAR
jgi:hypothetical protein